ncbi:MAG: hydroxyacid dehydrogenase [Candidatus Magasanikbacteria bacterium]|nr:hydroxyacid dehydrogenase [Candidatus Magasanikbacteria bacterium]
MLKPKVVVYNLWPELKDYARAKLRGFPHAIHTSALTPVSADPTAEVLVVFIESAATKDIMARLPKLRYITTMSTGYDHIDLGAAKKRQIPVSNVPTYGENTVAEHAFALILGLTRKLFESVKRVKEGRYDFRGLRGMDIKGKTLGVIGTGHIGANVARMAKGFEMAVLAYDAKPNPALAQTLGFTYVALPALLKKSDIVTIHAPLFPATYHLINKKNLALMKPGALLINTARGGIVDAEALLAALNSGRLAGAGLDVLEDENLLQNFEEVMRHGNTEFKLKTTLVNNLLIDHPNTIVTPHNAFNSAEALERIINVTVDNITSFAQGKIQNRVG